MRRFKVFMIINDRDGWIFLHNPKCAGSTVRKALMKHETRNNFYWFFGELDGSKIDKAHMPLMILRRYSPIDFELLRHYKVFGFVRNPYSRSISAYNETHQSVYKEFVSGSMSIDEYRENVNNFICKISDRVLNGLNFEYRHFVKQVDMFYFNGKCFADHIVNIENIESQSSRFFMIGGGVENLPDILKSRENDKRIGAGFEEVLDDSAISVINRIYRDDFFVFGYKMI
ncbi:MAG: sulfotransferase family 2 domain-containing protein [Pseudomonadota bacterium]